MFIDYKLYMKNPLKRDQLEEKKLYDYDKDGQWINTLINHFTSYIIKKATPLHTEFTIKASKTK